MEHYTCLYECDCGETWESTWSCACNDRCPACNAEIEPSESENNWEGLAYALFTVQAELTVKNNQLNQDDQDCLEEILSPYDVEARCADEALDIYHCNIPVAVLDDFEFECHLSILEN